MQKFCRKASAILLGHSSRNTQILSVVKNVHSTPNLPQKFIQKNTKNNIIVSWLLNINTLCILVFLTRIVENYVENVKIYCKNTIFTFVLYVENSKNVK